MVWFGLGVEADEAAGARLGLSWCGSIAAAPAVMLRP